MIQALILILIAKNKVDDRINDKLNYFYEMEVNFI
jgi:hypothetical protein